MTGHADGGYWIAYYSDWSGAVIFETEIDALREAIRYGMQVGRVAFGQHIGPGAYPKGGN